MGVRRRAADDGDRLDRLRAEAETLGAWWRRRASTGHPLTASEYDRLARLESLASTGWAGLLAGYEPTLALPDDDPVRRSITEHRAKAASTYRGASRPDANPVGLGGGLGDDPGRFGEPHPDL